MDNNTMYDVIILGGGPAGVAGGVYASRKRLKSLIISKTIGGQAINSGSIENFIGHTKLTGIDFSKMLEDHLRAQDHIDIKDGMTISNINEIENGIEVEVSSGEKYSAKTILYALGSNYRKLNAQGENELEGKGVFYCSICDAPLMRDKDVAVIGGGNSAAEAVFDLLPYAKKIYILQHSGKLKMEGIYKERIKTDNKIEIILNAEVIKISGNPMVDEVEYKDISSGKTSKLDVRGVFVSIGFIPNTNIIKDIVNTNERGGIIVDHKTFKTSNQRIWAAGDVTDVLYKQINPAIGDGVNAMLSIYNFLKAIKK